MSTSANPQELLSLGAERSHYGTAPKFAHPEQKPRTFRGRGVLGVKRRELEQEITSVYLPPPHPALHHLRISEDSAATGGALA